MSDPLGKTGRAEAGIASSRYMQCDDPPFRDRRPPTYQGSTQPARNTRRRFDRGREKTPFQSPRPTRTTSCPLSGRDRRHGLSNILNGMSTCRPLLRLLKHAGTQRSARARRGCAVHTSARLMSEFLTTIVTATTRPREIRHSSRKPDRRTRPAPDGGVS